jgi:dihydrofolate reductase
MSGRPRVLSMIAAVARNGVIGNGHTLLWRLPEDQQHFKRNTLGQPVIMGRKTWDSLPAAYRPLPGRRNIVVTRNPRWHANGAEVVTSLEAALERAADADKAFVIGGGELYAQALPHADELLLTEIDRNFDGDTVFPAWDRNEFIERQRERHHAGPPNDFDYAFVTYQRKSA